MSESETHPTVTAPSQRVSDEECRRCSAKWWVDGDGGVVEPTDLERRLAADLIDCRAALARTEQERDRWQRLHGKAVAVARHLARDRKRLTLIMKGEMNAAMEVERVMFDRDGSGWRGMGVLKGEPAWCSHFWAGMFAREARENGAINFLETAWVGEDGQRVIVTVQAPGGKTPAEMKAAAEQERDAARAALARERERAEAAEAQLAQVLEEASARVEKAEQDRDRLAGEVERMRATVLRRCPRHDAPLLPDDSPYRRSQTHREHFNGTNQWPCGLTEAERAILAPTPAAAPAVEPAPAPCPGHPFECNPETCGSHDTCSDSAHPDNVFKPAPVPEPAPCAGPPPSACMDCDRADENGMCHAAPAPEPAKGGQP
jgi:hypothetical protein